MMMNTNLLGLYSRQRMERYWTTFDHDLYRRICEIKYQEI